MNPANPTARGRWLITLEKVLPEPMRLPLHNVHVIGPFENAGYQGLLTAYPPEQEIDLTAVYPGKSGEVGWQHVQDLEGVSEQPADLSTWLPTKAWSVLYVYAEVEVEKPQITELITGLPANVVAWGNGQLVLSPTIPHLEKPQDDPRLYRVAPWNQYPVDETAFWL